MKTSKSVLVITIFFISLFTSQLHSQSYLGASLLYFFDNNIGEDTGVSGKAGFRVVEDNYIEIELIKAELDNSVGAVNTNNDLTSYMLNYKLKCQISKTLGLYLGAGLGITDYEIEIEGPAPRIELDDTVFTYQLLIGASVRLSKRLKLIAGYRYIELDGYNDNGLVAAELDSSIIEIGINYRY